VFLIIKINNFQRYEFEVLAKSDGNYGLMTKNQQTSESCINKKQPSNALDGCFIK